MTDEEIVKEALTWVRPHTPWKHGVAIKGYGADCVQFIVAMAKTFGWLPADFKTISYQQDYAEHNTKSVLRRELEKYCTEIPITDIRVGDILTFVFGRCASHAGMYIGNDKMIHCHIRHGVTVVDIRHILNKFDSAWRING